MNKKKKITILVCTLFMVFSLGACGKTKEDAAVVTQQESSLQIESMDEETTSEESTTFNNGEEDDIELKDTIEIDFTYDYTEDIKVDVAYVVSNSSSLQEELKNIDTITQKYTLLAESALTQGEMNVASQWLYVIWDTELNNLWRRFSSLANQDTKEMVLEEQRNWIARAMIDFLLSTGIRVGELVRLNIDDIDFSERECVVYGKGDKERKAYFDAKTKIHLLNYIELRTDNNIALFVSLNKPHSRLTESGVELRLREMGKKLGVEKVRPHKFRRTMATRAIEKGMPIEQVQKILGHEQIDTTLRYAMVNQNNVKLSHRKYIS